MQYGFPYRGSKSKIAEGIITILPKADNFYDLFAGGGAITHCALLSNKWTNIIANDIQNTMSLFLEAVNGKYKNEKREEVEISSTQRYKALGNAFNVDVVCHILKNIG